MEDMMISYHIAILLRVMRVWGRNKDDITLYLYNFWLPFLIFCDAINIMSMP